MTNTITGNCLCGTVAYEVENQFDNLYFCHCAQCRKITSSAHASNLFRDLEDFRWTLGQDQITQFQLPDRGFRTTFCKQCGSGLPFISKSGKKLIVPAGSLNGEPVFARQARIFMDEQAEWHNVGLAASTFDKFPKS